MGVYHLMGLGRSVGVVTGPLSYLAHRYQRWNQDDQAFFSHSGEVTQRQAGKKVGDVQALVLFTTKEIIEGRDEASGEKFLPLAYIENQPGRVPSQANTIPPKDPMKACLERFLKKIWPGVTGRQKADIFWCEIDRFDFRTSFFRVARVMAALSEKEQWVNLTGGTNVTNSALQLAATLTGEVARLYYVQAANDKAEKCIYFTSETRYWVELPIMPLALRRVIRAILELLQQHSPIDFDTLYSRLQSSQDYGTLVVGMSRDNIREILRPLWKQGLISGTSDKNGPYTLGEQWEVIRPYFDASNQAKESKITIEQLARQEDWLTRQTISFSS